LRQGISNETAERIGRVYALTENSVLVLLDGSAYDDQLAEALYQQLKIRQTPAVLLLVRRRFTKPPTDGRRTFWLPEELSRAEADLFATRYAAVIPTRAIQLTELTKRSGSERSAFYFGLTAFGREFAGLPNYISVRLATLTEAHKPVVVFLALAYHYA